VDPHEAALLGARVAGGPHPSARASTSASSAQEAKPWKPWSNASFSSPRGSNAKAAVAKPAAPHNSANVACSPGSHSPSLSSPASIGDRPECNDARAGASAGELA
jgi:hypothetical protein